MNGIFNEIGSIAHTSLYSPRLSAWVSVVGILLSTLLGNAATYYVSPTGSTGNTGLTPASPWPFAYALTHGANTYICLPGNYTGPFDCNVSGAIIQAQTKWTAVFTSSSYGLYIDSNATHDVTFDGLKVQNCGDSAIGLAGYNCVVRNCWLLNNNGNGIEALRHTGGLFEKNLSDRNGQRGAGFGGGTAHGIYISGTNNIVRNNVFRYNAAFGIHQYTDTASSANNQYYGNLTYGQPANTGTFTSGNKGATFYGGTGLAGADLGTNAVYHNTFVDGIDISYGTLNLTNNIVLANGIKNVSGGAPIAVNANYNLRSSTTWAGANDVATSNAGFVNSANGLYWLAAGSAARSVALSTVFPAVDFFGNSQSSASDIGAFTYSSTYAADTRTLYPNTVNPDYWAGLGGPIYYVDFDAGNDSNSGISQSSPWHSLPGMRTTGDSGYVSTSYGGGTFTYNANKVPAGTTFKIKRGTSWTSSDGSWWQCDSLWYQNGTISSPITIQADTSWGVGQVIIDGAGATMPNYRGMFNLDNIKYLVIDGIVPSGIVIKNTTWNGIRAFGTGVNGLTLKNLEVLNGPVALVSVFSSDSGTPLYLSDVTLDNVIAHDTSGTDDTSSCIYGSWLNNFLVRNCTTYNSGSGADGIHIESSHYGWILNHTSYSCGEQGIDISRNGSFKTRDDSYYITIRDSTSHDNKVNDFDHNSGAHHIAWINCFGWKTTSGQLGDPTFNVHEGSAGPNWWINCSSSKSMEGGFQFTWGSNPWSIPAGAYPQYYINDISSGDSTLPSSRWGSLLTDSDVTGCSAITTIVNSILNTPGNTIGTVNYKGTAFTPANVATGSGGFSTIGTGCLTNSPAWLTPNATAWALSNETPGTGSPAINGGAWVFRTSGAGVGSTALSVTNAYGLAVTNVFRAGDYIQIESGSIVQVSSVNGSSVIVLTAASSWSSAKGVWFNQGGTSPLIGAGATPSLGFSSQPTSVLVTSNIFPAVAVTAYAANGSRDTGFTGNITVAIGNNPSGGVLSGTLTKAAFAGIATFDNLSISLAGNNYTLIATSATIPRSASSAAFNINPVTPPAPITPTLITPANNATGVSTVAANFIWSAVANATSYQIQIATNSGFTGTLTADVSNITGLSFTTSLSAGTQYYWHIRATGVGGTSAYTTAFTFNTTVNPPSAPTLLTPANTAVGVSTTPTFTWTLPSGATSHQILIATDVGFTSIIVDQSNITATNFTSPVTLATSTTHYWKVRSSNTGGTSAYSTAFNFSTAAPPAPGVPTWVAPANGAIDIVTSPTLRWGGVVTASSYHLQVSTNATFTGTLIVDLAGLTVTNYVPNLQFNTTNWCKVLASNAGGSSAYSSAISFVTTNTNSLPAIPAIPVLVSPANNAVNQALSLTLSWTPVSFADSYGLQIATDAGFSSLVLNLVGLPTTSYTTTLSAGTSYYYRVNARNIAGSSAYSAGRLFSTVPVIPAVPTLVYPANNSVGISTSPTVQWTAVPGAASYQVQVSAVTNFSSTIYDVSGVTATSYLVLGLTNSVDYFYRVRSSNSGGTSVYSTAWRFTVTSASPGVPILISPANNAINQSINPVLSWRIVVGASSYRLQVSTNSLFVTTNIDQPNIGGGSYSLATLAFSKAYYWRVASTNAAGASAFTATRKFTTASRLLWWWYRGNIPILMVIL